MRSLFLCARPPDGITGKNYATPLPNNKIPFPISPAECRALPSADNGPTDADAANAGAADVLTHSLLLHSYRKSWKCGKNKKRPGRDPGANATYPYDSK